MSPSPAFARIKHDVLRIVAAIPHGKLTTFAHIGEFLDVVPRQVAYLLALRNDADREATPWWRVVGVDGVLGTPKYTYDGRSQEALLQEEGHTITRGRVVLADAALFGVTTASTGVTPVPRPSATRPPRPRR